jgi:hypothetical protein
MTIPEAAPGPPEHFVGLILGALTFGVTLGAGLLSLVTWAIRTLQGSGLSLTQTERGFTAGLLPIVLAGTFGAMLAGGFATWKLLAPIGNPWRQAMLGVIAGAGSFVVALVTWPVDRAFGPTGLLVLAGLAAVLCGLIARQLTIWRKTA